MSPRIESRIVWLGSIFDEATLLSRVAISPAANRWQQSMIDALQRLGIVVQVIGHLPEPFWPRGQMRIRPQDGSLASDIQGQLIGYWNLPALRNASLCNGYRKLVKQIGVPHVVCSEVVLTYNGSPAKIAGAKSARRRYGASWVCIVADGEAPPDADGYIFLTWEYFERFAGQSPKLHLDGGVSRMKSSPKSFGNDGSSGRRVVIYTGALTRHGGAEFLAQAFHSIDDSALELWLCGKGFNAQLERLAATDSRIKVMGLLPENELVRLCKQADVFINPRPSNVAVNQKNFPSKVLEYLSYGKPVISTWTAGLSPEYRDVLIVLERETQECLASTIKAVLNWDFVQCSAMNERIAKFHRNHSWAAQAERLIQWLDRALGFTAAFDR